LAENFIDKTPPEGRQQGPEGAILASRAFRQAVPDLRCDVEQMIVAGDRVVSHLHFHGHFTGTFGTRKGKGQNIDFIATDIYQISGGKIAANWHIEDNLTLMKQLGAQ
ncbi:ester cyclase, partial [Klebsiella quasipneumoniae]